MHSYHFTVLLLFLIPALANSQITEFFDEAAFDADVAANCPSCLVEIEGFEGFASNDTIDYLSYDFTDITLCANLRAFYGSWSLFGGCFNTFSGSSLLSTPVYNSAPAILTFSKPVYGFGGYFYDDGAPEGDITLTVTTAANNIMSITETCNSTGDTGFMGFTTSEGIKQIVFTIDIGAVEMDNMKIAQFPFSQQSITFTDTSSFKSFVNNNCINCQIEEDDVESYNGTVSQIDFNNTSITFTPNSPSTFAGGWAGFPGCEPGTFQGKGLIPEPRFNSSPVTFNFSEPVYAFGADVFDDGDGSPSVNQITLTAVSVQNDTLHVSDSCQVTGDVGFLGIVMPDGIREVTFSIDGLGGNLEIDNLRLVGGFCQEDLIDTVLSTATLCDTTLGTIEVATLDLGCSAFSYSIDNLNFQPDNTFDNLSAGSYTVLVKNQNGCTDTISAMVEALPAFSYDSVFSDKSLFNNYVASVCPSCITDIEDFDSYTNDFPIPDLTFTTTQATFPFAQEIPFIRFGSWNSFPGCEPGTFSEGSLVPRPAYSSQPLTFVFLEPIYGFGADLYDDGDGTPVVNTLSMSATGLSGEVISISESCDVTGDVGFMGIIMQEGITQVTISIDGAGGNLEIDHLHVVQSSTCGFALIDTVETQNALCGAGTTRIDIVPVDPRCMTYSIDGINFQDQNSYVDLPAGDYSVYAQNILGCVDSMDVTIEASDAVEIVDIIETPTGCDPINGMLEISAIGGAGTLEYTIDGLVFQTGNIFNGLGEGDYTVTVQDGSGCTATQVANILQTSDPTIDDLVSVNATCGNDNGTLVMDASGGTGTLMYSIDGLTFQNDPLFADLAGNTYTVIVLDENGCTASQSVEVQQEEAPEVVGIVISDATCGEDNGAITVNAAGGTSPLQYSLNGAAFTTDPVFVNLPAGDYTLSVQDANGCLVDSVATLVQLGSPMIINQLTANTICGEDNGWIHISAIGGSGTLEFSLDGVAFQSSNTFSDLPAGNYTVSVKDENNCTDEVSLTIEPSDAPAIDDFSVTNALCDENNGEITITASGGTSPLQYSVDGLTYQGSSVFPNLPGGDFTLIVQDSEGCADTSLVSLIQEGAPSITNIEAIDASCQNPTSITVFANGGTGVLQYSIDGSNYQQGNSFTGLPTGDYTVFVVDENDCMVSGNASVIQPPELEITGIIVTDATCFGNDGSIDILATGGLGILQFSIDGTSFQNAEIFTDLPAGIYEPTVMDINGCEVSQTIEVTQNEFPEITNVEISPSSCGSNGSIRINAAGGTGALQYFVNSVSDSTTQTFDDLSPGTYEVLVVDEDGCAASQSALVPNECNIYIPNSFSPNDDGINDLFQIFADWKTEAVIIEFLVFDRWGGLRYKSGGFSIHSSTQWWDGRTKGEKVTPGIYTYLVRIGLGDGMSELLERGEVLVVP